MMEPTLSGVTEAVSLETFLANLRRAGRGVVRVGIGERMSCTGWMVTESLVILPDYVLQELPDEVWCQFPGSATVSRAQIVHASGVSSPHSSSPLTEPALLRLVDPPPDSVSSNAQEAPVLPFQRTSPRPGESVILLHYPHGSLDLMVSTGRIIATGPDGVRHDVASAPGSGGAPLLSAETGAVLGMHYAHYPDGAAAVSAADVLDSLSRSDAWPEIARRHRIAGAAALPFSDQPAPGDVPGETRPPDGSETVSVAGALLRAAMAWTFAPEELSPEDREEVRPYIDEPEEPEWSLAPEQRHELITAAGSLDTLRATRKAKTDPGPADRTVDRILAGPPYDLADVPDDDLPYWLQAVPWFAAVIPDLPTPAAIHRELQARRIRSRLRPIATTRLWGRDEQLEQLREWWQRPEPAPMVVTGIGGVGKSALVARFALDLPDDTALLWLDFDRPDLAPDNAVSVLSALTAQLAVQLPDYTVPPVDVAIWPTVAAELGQALRGRRALLVLDGFEVAQHAPRHEELWGVLESILRTAPDLPVVVSGRAPVPGLELVGRVAESLPLTGLAPDVARAWFVRQGVTEPSMLDAAVRICDGVPLLLKLAVRLVEAGGDVSDFPASLSRALVDGFLYQRILFRVVEPRLRPLAHDALVLRRITRDVLVATLHDRMPEGLDADDVVARLTRELALVENSDQAASTLSLRLRPEVRVATLRLLETEDAERVALIDRRAADWYAPAAGTSGNGPDRVAVAAEAVYHRARLGDVAGAAAVWVDGCESMLAGADKEVPERYQKARDWLRARVAGMDPAVHVVSPLVEWEATAHRRIRDALSRGLERTVGPILSEVSFRGPESPLLVYDAWVLREDGALQSARQLLKEAPTARGPAVWPRAIVAARTAALSRDTVDADRILAGTASTFQPPEPDQVLAVIAARIRFATDITAEARLLDKDGERAYRGLLGRWDVVLPQLRPLLGRGVHEAIPPLPEHASESEDFAQWLDSSRARTAALAGLPAASPVTGSVPDGPLPVSPPDAGMPYPYLEELAAHRWRLVLRSGFLSRVRDVLVETTFVDQLRLSLGGAMAAFSFQELHFQDGSVVSDHVLRAMRHAGTTVLGNDFTREHQELETLLGVLAESDVDIRTWRDLEQRSRYREPWTWTSRATKRWPADESSALLFTFGPEPLEQLERRVLGLPELKAK
jgi:hypothetical protein